MAVWFTADTHFGHGGAIGRWKRPFASVPAMDEALVANWNAYVGRADDVWHLGDFAFRLSADRAAAILRRLNGRKHLLLGNNDGPEIAALSGWASVGHYAETELDGTALVLCHYALRTWNGMRKGALNLHGHSHGALAPLTRQVDVGVDVWDYRPVSLAAIRSRPRRAARGKGRGSPLAKSAAGARVAGSDPVRGSHREE